MAAQRTTVPLAVASGVRRRGRGSDAQSATSVSVPPSAGQHGQGCPEWDDLVRPTRTSPRHLARHRPPRLRPPL